MVVGDVFIEPKMQISVLSFFFFFFWVNCVVLFRVSLVQLFVKVYNEKVEFC